MPIYDRAALAALLMSVSIAPALANRDLTPQVRAVLFAPPLAVSFAEPVVTIPLQGTDDRGFYRCPYMRAYVNGKGPFTFLFDTGSSYTMVSRKVIAAAKPQVVFDRGGERDVVRLHKVTIGGVSVSDLWAIHDDTFGVDGVFGFQAFGDNNLLFEAAKHRLRVSASPIFRTGGFTLPYRLSHFIPTIDLIAGEKTISALIDSGDDAYAWELRSSDLQGVPFAHPPVAAESVLNGANEAGTRVTTLAVPLHLGPLSADAPVAGINDDLPVPDIGMAVIEQFNVEFDRKRQTVTFHPLAAGRKFRVPANLSPGFKLRFDGKGTVGGALPDTAAARAGLQADDVILSVNGVRGASLTPMSWDRLLSSGASLSVRWRHGATEYQNEFPVTELR